MEKTKIKTREEKREIVRIIHYAYCPKCDKEIKGTKPSQVEYNLKLHMDSKHGRKKK